MKIDYRADGVPSIVKKDGKFYNRTGKSKVENGVTSYEMTDGILHNENRIWIANGVLGDAATLEESNAALDKSKNAMGLSKKAECA